MQLKCVNFVRLLIAYTFRNNWQQIPVKVQNKGASCEMQIKYAQWYAF